MVKLDIFLKSLEENTIPSLVNPSNVSESQSNPIKKAMKNDELSFLSSIESQVIRLNKDERTRVAKTLLEAGLSFDEVSLILSSVPSQED